MGEKYSITPLFNIFNIIPEFLLDLKDKKICSCGNAYVRDFQFGSLLLLTTEELQEAQGKVDIATNKKLSNYSNPCLRCGQIFPTQRIIIKFPTFFFILLEVCDSFNSLDSRQNFQYFDVLTLQSTIILENHFYELAAICYFQAFHYTAHINNASFPQIQLNSVNWNYHDGIQNDGKLAESIPSLEYRMKESSNIPYILMYKTKI